jgi:hypothetical protein
MVKSFCILLVIFMLSSCEALEPLNLWKPKTWGMTSELSEEFPPKYRQGFKDGCETGNSAYGGAHYRNLGYKYTQDLTMINDPEYYKAWQNGYRYCRWYQWNFQRNWNGGVQFMPNFF